MALAKGYEKDKLIEETKNWNKQGGDNAENAASIIN